MFWLWFSLGAALLVALPFLRLLIKRLILRVKLKKVLKSVGGRLIPGHRLWLFGRRSGARCDFYAETSEGVFAVKLFTVLFKLSVLTFHKDSCAVTYHIPMFSRWGSVVSSPFSSKAKRLPTFDRARLPAGIGGEGLKPVLLVHPACFELRRQTGVRSFETAHDGDAAGDWRAMSLSGLLKRISDGDNQL